MPPPRCPRCNYDLTGLTVESSCPECARPIWTQPKKRRKNYSNALSWFGGAGVFVVFTFVLFDVEGWSLLTVTLPILAIAFTFIGVREFRAGTSVIPR